MKNILITLLILLLFGCSNDVLQPNETPYNNTYSSEGMIKKLQPELELITIDEEILPGLCLCECVTTNNPYDGMPPEIEWLDECYDDMDCLLQCANYCYIDYPDQNPNGGEWWEINNYECIGNE